MDFTKVDLENLEVPPYRKKSKSKAPKKANHKHQYRPVILYYLNRHSWRSDPLRQVEAWGYARGKECTICGRLEMGFPNGYANKHSEFGFFYPNIADPAIDYPDMPVIKIDDIWASRIERV